MSHARIYILLKMAWYYLIDKHLHIYNLLLGIPNRGIIENINADEPLRYLATNMAWLIARRLVCRHVIENIDGQNHSVESAIDV